MSERKDGVLYPKDFLNEFSNIKRNEYLFPEEVGKYTVEGSVLCRYWGKKGNIILLVDSSCGRKLKFSFWNNAKYCPQPIGEKKKGLDVEKHSVRFFSDGIRIELVYERLEGWNHTRVRWIEKLY